MQLIKKNILSILCGVVALVGVIAIFYPIGPMYDKANAALAERAELHQKIESLRTTPRSWPTIDKVEAGEPVPLEQFPSQAVIEQGKRATGDLKKQANQMLAAAVELNTHEPLHRAALPEARGAAAANITFRDKYLARLQEFLPNDVLNSGVPPTKEDIEEAARKLWFDRYTDRIVFIGNEPDAEHLENLQTEYLDEVNKLPERMRLERARTIKVYMEPDALAVSPEVGRPGETPASEDIWYAQVALWIQEDVAKAVAQLNTGTVAEVDAKTGKKTLERDRNVTDNPVKQIISLDVEFGPQQFVMKQLLGGGGIGVGGGGEEDSSAASADAEGGPKEYELSPTGRACNSVYDVVHFTTVLRVDGTQIPLVLDELRRDKFITPIKVDVSAVDAAQAMKEGYVYCEKEPKPIVDLTIQGEALFLRQWTLPLMPRVVQEALGITKESEGGEEAESDVEARAPTPPLPDRLAVRD